MFRVLSTTDVLFTLEIHNPAVGFSVGTLYWLPPFAKESAKVYVEALSRDPMGVGHDTGFTRPHVLIAPNPLASVGLSVVATLTSSCKPMFSSHKTLVNSGGALPITAEVVPMGFLSCVVCGAPVSIPNLTPIIPMQFSVFTGMTLGDIIGGIVNMVVEMGVSLVLGLAGGHIGGKVFPKVGEGVFHMGKALVEGLIGIVAGAGKAAQWQDVSLNLDTGIDNPGRLVQEAIDDDNIGSDAGTGVRVLGFGVGGKSSQKGGRIDGVTLVGPWNKEYQ